MSACAAAAWGDEPWAAKNQQAHSRAIGDQQAKIWIVVLILIIPLVGSGYVTPDLALQVLSLLIALLHHER